MPDAAVTFENKVDGSKTEEVTSSIETLSRNVHLAKLQVGASPYSRFSVRFSSNSEDYDVRILNLNIFNFPSKHYTQSF